MVNLTFLRTFATVAKTGSFRITADRTFITQPAVSQHIQILEQKLGCKLFERQGKKIFLTPAGKMFSRYADQILNLYKEAELRVTETVNENVGTVKIATIYSIGLHDLQPIIKRFLKKYPKIKVHLEYHQSPKIYEMVLNRDVDFGIVAFPKKGQSYQVDIIDQGKIVLVQSPQYPAYKQKTIDIPELDHANFVAFSSNTPTGQAIDRFFKSNKIYPNIITEYDNIETLKSAVIIGMGCTLAPKTTVHRELKDKTLEIINVRKLNFVRPLGILYPNSRSLTQSARRFHEMITL